MGNGQVWPKNAKQMEHKYISHVSITKFKAAA